MTTEIEPYSMMQPVAAAILGETPTTWPDGGGVFVVSCFLFLLFNAFFVTSEFAIVKVRPSHVESLAETSAKKARKAQRIINKLDAYLSSCLFGMTVVTIGLAIFAESYIHECLSYMLGFGLPTWFGLEWFSSAEGVTAISITSKVVALGFFTVLHVIIGQLIPKAVAIRKPIEVATLIASPLHFFYLIFSPFIWMLAGVANFILKHICRIEPVSEGEHVHSAEELALLVTESGAQQEVTDTEREILINALELNDISVYDVMTPRTDVVALDIDDSFEDIIDIAKRSKHTRFPVVQGHLDNTLGLVHIKDILGIVGEKIPDLRKIMRDLKAVPATMPLDVLLKFFQKEHEHLALVVDEYGAPSGLVFLDNVLEELVGDIQDEFDNEAPEFARLNDNEFVVEGSLTLNDLSDHAIDLKIESGEVSTVGGYVTQQFERLPNEGQEIRILEYMVKVISVDDRKIGQLHFRKLTERELHELEEEGVAVHVG